MAREQKKYAAPRALWFCRRKLSPKYAATPHARAASRAFTSAREDGDAAAAAPPRFALYAQGKRAAARATEMPPSLTFRRRALSAPARRCDAVARLMSPYTAKSRDDDER